VKFVELSNSHKKCSCSISPWHFSLQLLSKPRNLFNPNLGLLQNKTFLKPFCYSISIQIVFNLSIPLIKVFDQAQLALPVFVRKDAFSISCDLEGTW
jgi:hypothetical protein